MGNPLVCDCHMSWISQLPSTVMIQDAICMEPVALQGRDLLSALPQLNQTCPGQCVAIYSYRYIIFAIRTYKHSYVPYTFCIN